MSSRSPIVEFFDKSVREGELDSKPLISYEVMMRQHAVANLLGNHRSGPLLDIGCGEGRDLPILAPSGEAVVGADISAIRLSKARSSALRFRIPFLGLVRCDVRALPFKSNSFDTVLCSEVLEHVPRWEEALHEIQRIIAQEGRLVITVPNRNSLYGLNRKIIEAFNSVRKRRPWSHPHDEWKTRSELAAVLKKSGFRVDREIGICYLPGFSVSILPKPVQQFLVGVTEELEKRVQYALPAFGYMLGMSAVKGRGAGMS